MKTNYFIVLLFIASVKSFAQSDPKTIYQKNRYELAISYYKKADYENALALFSIASKMKSENEIGIESVKRIDTLRKILRKRIMDKVVGTWKLVGDKPLWSVNTNGNKLFLNRLVEINYEQISFYELDTQTKEKKLLKTEKLSYYNKDPSDDLFSAIIFSDGTIWECLLNEDENVLHVINIAKKTENGVEKITNDNLERFLSKIN
ncbi:hypothetical protein [Flavobacterium sp. T12S277]|uniref:hypothetical protein n=1 Tax=Flavobacterium sp. T12S277 TaxID=3402752 RepID=UPI003AE9356D